MLTHTQLQFFVLLRAGLWDKPVDVNELQNPEAYQRTGSEKNPEAYQETGSEKNPEAYQETGSKKNTGSVKDTGSEKNPEAYQRTGSEKNTGSKKNTGSAPNTDVDWPAIYRIASEQTVVGLIADAIGTLPKDHRPPMPILQKFIMDKLAIERSHVKLNAVLNEVVEALNAHNIPHVLLKGQGVAQNYPHPTSRTCGDIDLYVGEKYYTAACRIVNSLSETPGIIVIENDKHYSQIVHGVDIEIHHIVTVVYNPFVKKEFQRFTLESLDNNFNCDNNTKELEHWNNNGTIINLPQVDFAIVFLLIHPYHHLIESGIGMRQLCDFALYLNNHQKKLDKRKILQEIANLGLKKSWMSFTSILHLYLGLSEDKIPGFKIEQKKAEKIIRIILKGGNFGHYDQDNYAARNSKYLIHKWKRFTYHINYYTSTIPLFPKIGFWYFLRWLNSGIKEVFHGLIKR